MKITSYKKATNINPEKDLLILEQETTGTSTATVNEILNSGENTPLTFLEESGHINAYTTKDNKHVMEIDPSYGKDATGYSDLVGDVMVYNLSVLTRITPIIVDSKHNPSIGRKAMPFGSMYSKDFYIVEGSEATSVKQMLTKYTNRFTNIIKPKELDWIRSANGMYYTSIKKIDHNFPTDERAIQCCLKGWGGFNQSNIFMFYCSYTNFNDENLVGIATADPNDLDSNCYFYLSILCEKNI